ncbi:MAG: hypothetical protein PUC77_01820 [Bacteroidales bacterium]|nr:hypothetical protein [Bacteroidales bacterium]MDD6140591.1 hypothetical protein [Bacteroidales bacterium]MDD6668299.1 hypothetical protein [Bacteroidales bacterium]
MEQDTNKEDLRKLLNFLKNRILSVTSNRWFANELYKILAPESDAKISDIQEQCIESILKEQAVEFYKDFVIEELRPQLISDFVKMEHWRRRNNIQEFGMAVFQQIEAIINRISYDNTLSEVFMSMMNALCYVDAGTPKIDNRYTKSTYTIAQLLFINQKDIITKSARILPEQWVYDKFKAINYFVCHQACLTNFQFNQFKEENDLFGQLYGLRNLNHRGNSLKDTEIERVKEFESNPGRAFLTITSFLCWFVDSVNKGFPISKELIDYAKTDFKQVTNSVIGPKIMGKIDVPDDGKKRFK